MSTAGWLAVEKSMSHDPRRPRHGFTLIELIVVIAIIAILASLLIPTVQAVRESARVAQCRNQTRQLAVGCLTHLETQRFWPSGGWGFLWTGEPDRGFGRAQPGGWAYSVLPYIEQTVLHQLGAGQPAASREAAMSQRAATPVSTFYCPSRRPPVALPSNVHIPINCPIPAAYAKSDYALNIGSTQVGGQFLPQGPPKTCLQDYPRGSCIQCPVGSDPLCGEDNWYGRYGQAVDPDVFVGISTHRSERPASAVVDGLSTTLLLAEKYLNPDRYLTGDCGADNGDAWQGRDWDTARWSADPPLQDTRGVDQWTRFGGPHGSGVVAAACDGSVRVVTWRVDPAVWLRLGNCQDTTTGTDVTSWPGR